MNLSRITPEELRRRLNGGPIHFAFKKLDGTLRTAVGTTCLTCIRTDKHPSGGRTASEKVVTFFDVEKGEGSQAEVVAFVQALRAEDLFKTPGVAETIDWARCLVALDTVALSPEVIADTLGAVLKYQDDIARLAGSEAQRVLNEARARLGRAG